MSIEQVKDKYFDFIVIGAGTAGSVLSFMLTKNSNYTVLLIEAGGTFSGVSAIVPLMSPMMQGGTKLDWRFELCFCFKLGKSSFSA